MGIRHIGPNRGLSSADTGLFGQAPSISSRTLRRNSRRRRPGRWACRGGAATAAAGDGDRGQQLHRVAVALRAGRRRGGLGHRAADLKGVAAGAAAVVVTRHCHSVGPLRAPAPPPAGRRVRVGSDAWRRDRRHQRTSPACAHRRRTSAGRWVVPARRRRDRARTGLRSPRPRRPRRSRQSVRPSSRHPQRPSQRPSRAPPPSPDTRPSPPRQRSPARRPRPSRPAAPSPPPRPALLPRPNRPPRTTRRAAGRRRPRSGRSIWTSRRW